MRKGKSSYIKKNKRKKKKYRPQGRPKPKLSPLMRVLRFVGLLIATAIIVYGIVHAVEYYVYVLQKK